MFKEGGDSTDHVELVEFALVVLDDLGGRSHVRRDQDIGPVILPLSVVIVVIGCRRNLLQSLGIIAPSAIDAIASSLSLSLLKEMNGQRVTRVSEDRLL